MRNIVIVLAIAAAFTILTVRPVFKISNSEPQNELSGRYVMSSPDLDLGYFEFENGEFERFQADGSFISKGTVYIKDGIATITTSEGVVFASGKITPDGEKIYLHKDDLESGITIKKVD